MFGFLNNKKKINDKKNKVDLTFVKKIIPSSYVDAKEIAEIFLKEKKICVYFLKIEKNERIRIIDFLSGITFVYKGKIEKIEKKTYVFTI